MIRIWKSFSGKKHPQNRRKQNLRTRRQDAPPTSETWHNRWLESETSLGFEQPGPPREMLAVLRVGDHPTRAPSIHSNEQRVIRQYRYSIAWRPISPADW